MLSKQNTGHQKMDGYIGSQGAGEYCNKHISNNNHNNSNNNKHNKNNHNKNNNNNSTT